MRIAFVGKGGSGKTTTAALFTIYIANKNKPVLAIDADINMHMGELLGFKHSIPVDKQLSTPSSVITIKTYLKGNNKRIKELSHFRKTTPPTKESNFFDVSDNKNPILKDFSLKKDNITFMAVGTYDPEGIGASCYHNNLAILETLLSHTLDMGDYVVVDMVAGTDAFANTLHAQFDLLVLIIEPTRKGLEVFKQYWELAKRAKIEDQIVVIGNKIKDKSDKDFLKENIPSKLLFGFFEDSKYLKDYEKVGGMLDVDLLEKDNVKIIAGLFKKLNEVKPNYDKRLKKIQELHKKYVAQDSIKKQFGDLTNQIDKSFTYESVLNEHKK
jgi:CO dehydrogenase maturation factor